MEEYQRLSILGRGSFGQAILVKERRTNQFRVLKEIDLSKIPQKARDAAHTEVEVLKKLRHANIVAYYDSFESGSKLFIVMEFADGGDLSDSIKERSAAPSEQNWKRYREKEALDIFSQCCGGLSHIHKKHILHRDLKCQNIFLTKAGVVKIGDFGISKVMDATCAEAITFIGTPIYLAPEVCDNRPYGGKADIWSLGVVIYELLQLTPPFQAANVGALMMKILHGDPDPISPSLYSQGLRNLVAKMLRKSPDERPSIVELLLDPLISAIANGGEGARPERPPSAPAAAQRSKDALDKLIEPSGNSNSNNNNDNDATYIPGRTPMSVRERGEQRGRDARGGYLQAPGQQPRSGRPSASSASPSPALPASGLSSPSQQPSKITEEFLRNREIAARARARAEGDANAPSPFASPLPARSQSLEPSSGYGRRSGQRQGADEQQRWRELQQAAAQSRLASKNIQQKMLELERGGEAPRPTANAFGANSDGTALPQGFSAASSRAQEAEMRRLSEENHRKALLDAAAESRRERKQLQQKMWELEHGPPSINDATGLPSRGHGYGAGLSDGESDDAIPLTAQSRANAEAQRLKDLQSAAAEYWQDRKRLEQKMKELERGPAESSTAAPSGPKALTSAERAAAKQEAEALRLEELQQAAIQARRDQREAQKRMLEHMNNGGGVSSSSSSSSNNNNSNNNHNNMNSNSGDFDDTNYEGQRHSPTPEGLQEERLSGSETMNRTRRPSSGSSALRTAGDLISGSSARAKSKSRPSTAEDLLLPIAEDPNGGAALSTALMSASMLRKSLQEEAPANPTQESSKDDDLACSSELKKFGTVLGAGGLSAALKAEGSGGLGSDPSGYNPSRSPPRPPRLPPKPPLAPPVARKVGEDEPEQGLLDEHQQAGRRDAASAAASGASSDVIGLDSPPDPLPPLPENGVQEGDVVGLGLNTSPSNHHEDTLGSLSFTATGTLSAFG